MEKLTVLTLNDSSLQVSRQFIKLFSSYMSWKYSEKYPLPQHNDRCFIIMALDMGKGLKSFSNWFLVSTYYVPRMATRANRNLQCLCPPEVFTGDIRVRTQKGKCYEEEEPRSNRNKQCVIQLVTLSLTPFPGLVFEPRARQALYDRATFPALLLLF